jgi:hypothetical protein
VNDDIDGAIAATESGAVQMAQMQVRLASGRPMMIAMPADATDFEWLCGVRAVLDMRDKAQQQRGPALVIPRGLAIVKPS